MGSIQASQDISFNAMREKQSQLSAIVMADPAVQGVTTFVGGGGQMNSGNMIVHLRPFSTRNLDASQVIARLRQRLAVVPGATLYLQSMQDVQVGGRPSSSQFQFTLESENLAELNHWAPIMLAKIKTLPIVRDVATDQQDRGLKANLTIDRDTASRLGIPAEMIDNTLYDAFGQRQVSVLFTQMNEYHVVMEIAPEFQENPDSLQRLYVRSSSGTQVPLSAFTRYDASTTALAVNHQGQFPAVTLSFNLAPNVALGDAAVAIQDAEEKLGLPSSVQASFQGTAQAFQSSLKNQPTLILAALAVVYIVLGMLYESLIHPITILSTLPSAGVGALLALLAFRIELSVIALVGIILLIGIVKKNAIMMIDFAVETERKGKTPEESIYEACMLRFRPIMMTTMAALLGGLPLALGNGAGFELRRPLGISIVGGLIVSQTLTLFTTPVVYLYMDRLRSGRTRRRASPAGLMLPSEVLSPSLTETSSIS
jgi:multidrug efflux pump